MNNCFACLLNCPLFRIVNKKEYGCKGLVWFYGV